MNNNNSNNNNNFLPQNVIEVQNVAAQGDLFFVRIDDLPADAIPINVESINGHPIIGHSESGHHHVIDGGASMVQIFGSSDPNKMFMRVGTGARAVHLKAGLTAHQPFTFIQGIWEIHRQVEELPDGFKKAVVD